MPAPPRISICVPHWQVLEMMTVCLRSIRRHSAKYDLEVLVVDNGSRDASLDWLRSLSWIRLIERPDETNANWPTNVFTAWDAGARAARGELFLTMHSDVFVRRDDWLDPLLAEMQTSPQVAAAGAWKLTLEPAWYSWQKRMVGGALAGAKRLLGRNVRSSWKEGHYPRDYCALYRREALMDHGLTFCPRPGEITGGYGIARQLWEHGYETRVIPVWQMAHNVVHVAHGTAATSAEARLHHRGGQHKAEKRARALFAEHWVQQLRDDDLLDAA